MKLIEEIESRIDKNGILRKWGKFYCEPCKSYVERRLDAGKYCESCGCNRGIAIAEKSKKNWEKKEYVELQKRRHKDFWKDNEIAKSKHSFLTKNGMDKMEDWQKENIKNKLKFVWEDPIYKENQSKKHKEYFENNPKNKLNLSKKSKELWEIPKFREKIIKKQLEGRNKFLLSEESNSYRTTVSNRMKELWDDVNFKNLTVSKIMKSNGDKKGMNKPEKILLNLLSDLFFIGQFQYVGGGQEILGGKCPDFIDKINNKIIELYGDYWHRGQDPKDRINYFKNYGYDTLIIWEHELKNVDSLKSKLFTFGIKNKNDNFSI